MNGLYDTTDPRADNRRWRCSVLGDALANVIEAEPDCDALLAGLANSEPAALGLVGRLLVWRASSSEQLPPQLKEIGEAFYRWSETVGREPHALCRTLVAWLDATCAEARLGHRIELAHVGDRYDRLRHSSVAPGQEIASIHGWTVIREGGGIYTKAFVVAH
jgi:hypothetical protein